MLHESVLSLVSLLVDEIHVQQLVVAKEKSSTVAVCLLVASNIDHHNLPVSIIERPFATAL
jgi:hypothetical protein